MYDHTLFCACNAPVLTSPHVKLAVNLVIADGYLNLPHQFVWVLFIHRLNDDHLIILLVSVYVAGQTNLCTESPRTFGSGDDGRE